MDLDSIIHAAHWKGVVAITGCAPGLVTELLQPGGGSATLLDAHIPYASSALTGFIGHTPEKYCSQQVAQEMASAAFSRAHELREAGDSTTNLFGLGITATLRKRGSEREGRTHQVFISFQTFNMGYTHHVVFDSRLERLDEERLVTFIALDILSRHLLGKRFDTGLVLENKTIVNIFDEKDDSWFIRKSTERQRYPDDLKRLLDHSCDVDNFYTRDGIDINDVKILIPGSFNPFHKGHRQMAEIAERHFGTRPTYELSISNVDKGRLSGFEVLKRVEAFEKLRAKDSNPVFANLVVTNAPSFVEKALVFPNSVFVIGIDTWYRLIDDKYYRHSSKVRDECLEKIRERGCSFLVLGRFVNGKYHTLPNDETSKGLAVGLSEEEFRVDVSSSKLRAAR